MQILLRLFCINLTRIYKKIYKKNDKIHIHQKEKKIFKIFS